MGFDFPTDLAYEIPTIQDDPPDVTIDVKPGHLRVDAGNWAAVPTGKELRNAITQAFAKVNQGERRVAIVLRETAIYNGVNDIGDAYRRHNALPCPANPDDWPHAVTIQSDPALANRATIDGLGVWGLPPECELRVAYAAMRVPVGGAYAIGTPQFHRLNAIRLRDIVFKRNPAHTGYGGWGVFSWIRGHGGCGFHLDGFVVEDAAKEHVWYFDNSDFLVIRNGSGKAGGRTAGQHYARKDSSVAPLSWQGILWENLDFTALVDESYDGSFYTVGGYAGDIGIRNVKGTASADAYTGAIAVWSPLNLGGPYLDAQGFANSRLWIDKADFSGLAAGKADTVAIGGCGDAKLRAIQPPPNKPWISTPGPYSGAANGRVAYHRSRDEETPDFRAYEPGSKTYRDAVEAGLVRIV